MKRLERRAVPVSTIFWTISHRAWRAPQTIKAPAPAEEQSQLVQISQ
jgi:hypothetical protein